MSASCRAAPTAAWMPAPPEATEMVPDEVTVTPWFAPAESLPVDTASMPRWVVVLADVMAPAWGDGDGAGRARMRDGDAALVRRDGRVGGGGDRDRAGAGVAVDCDAGSLGVDVGLGGHGHGARAARRRGVERKQNAFGLHLGRRRPDRHPACDGQTRCAAALLADEDAAVVVRAVGLRRRALPDVGLARAADRDRDVVGAACRDGRAEKTPLSRVPSVPVVITEWSEEWPPWTVSVMLRAWLL